MNNDVIRAAEKVRRTYNEYISALGTDREEYFWEAWLDAQAALEDAMEDDKIMRREWEEWV